MARTQQVSVALEREALIAARKAAAIEGLSLSGLLMKLLTEYFEQRARFDAMDRFLREHARGVRVTQKHMQALRDEMTAPLKPVRRGGRRRAA
jgi:hypothetical protein